MIQNKIKILQITSQVTKQINVTNLTQNQKRELFIEHLTRAGFTGFIKNAVGEKTYYTFTYKG